MSIYICNTVSNMWRICSQHALVLLFREMVQMGYKPKEALKSKYNPARFLLCLLLHYWKEMSQHDYSNVAMMIQCIIWLNYKIDFSFRYIYIYVYYYLYQTKKIHQWRFGINSVSLLLQLYQEVKGAVWFVLSMKPLVFTIQISLGYLVATITIINLSLFDTC